jgi:MFS family permease
MDRSFSILMAGSSVSMLGTRISTIAFPLLVLHLSGSPLMAGVATFAAIAPGMLVYIPAGALVDRWNSNTVMLVSEIGRGIAIAFIVVALEFWHPSVYLLILAMIAEEVFGIFSALSERRFISWLVGREDASRAQAYVEVRTHAVVLTGRPFGPFLFEFTPILPFLVDAFSFAASVVSLALIRGRYPKAGQRTPWSFAFGRLAGDMKAGLTRLRSDRYAFMTVILMSATSLIAQALLLAFVAAAHAQELSTFAIGAVLAGSGAGGALGSLTAGKIPSRARQLWLQIQMCAWAGALALLFLTHTRSYVWIALAMSVLGFTGAVGNIELGAYLVRSVADNMLARITSIAEVIRIGGVSLGPVVGGALMRTQGISGVITWLFLLTFALVPVSFSVRQQKWGSAQLDPGSLAAPVMPAAALLTLEDPSDPERSRPLSMYEGLPAGGDGHALGVAGH